MRARALILLGAPGAGKGTQARGLAQHFGIAHISTGDILRHAVSARTPLGLAAQREMEAGHLVPDRIVNGLVRERLAQPDAARGFVLDGFPRTLAQARYLDRLLRAQGWGRPLVLNLRTDEDILRKRMTGRRTCPVCGEIYNIYFNPPQNDAMCDRECAKLIHRADDHEEVVGQRLAAYEAQTKPLIEYYSRRKLLHHIDGNGKPESVARELYSFLRDP